jgi:hypothetical protein
MPCRTSAPIAAGSNSPVGQAPASFALSPKLVGAVHHSSGLIQAEALPISPLESASRPRQGSIASKPNDEAAGASLTCHHVYLGLSRASGAGPSWLTGALTEAVANVARTASLLISTLHRVVSGAPLFRQGRLRDCNRVFAKIAFKPSGVAHAEAIAFT